LSTARVNSAGTATRLFRVCPNAIFAGDFFFFSTRDRAELGTQPVRILKELLLRTFLQQLLPGFFVLANALILLHITLATGEFIKKEEDKDISNSHLIGFHF
jgi:hypothetical protein